MFSKLKTCLIFFRKILSNILKLLSIIILIKPIKQKYLNFVEVDYSIEGDFLIDKKFTKIEVFKNNKKIIIPKYLEVYIYDLKNDFELYFDAVEPKFDGKYYTVDYRNNKIHKVKGYDLHKIMLPSFTESIQPLLQYLQFAELKEDSVVIDLGAYCGLASLIFDNNIGKQSANSSGIVIAVEADPKNIKSIRYNLAEYNKKTGRKIEFLPYAVWKERTTLLFASQGYMGASLNHVGCNRGKEISVKTITLSDIAKKYNLTHVDFIKCDIEGAEAEIFKDKSFFEKYSPKIIIECHYVDMEQTKHTKDGVIKILSQYGYECKEVQQHGFNLPLLECVKKLNLNE